MLSDMLSVLVIALIRAVTTIYSYATLPVYYLLDRPNRRLATANEVRAAQLDPLDPHSPWRRVGKEPEMEALNARTVDQMLARAVRVYGKDCEIAGVRVGGMGARSSYQWHTYGHLVRRVDAIARGLHLLGVARGDIVLVFAETRLEWILSAFAVFRLGASVTTLFAQLGADGIVHGINQTRVRFAITTRAQLLKLREVLPSTPSLEKIVDIDGTVLAADELTALAVEVLSLKQVESAGSESGIELSSASLNSADDIAVIMYTSGTTGNPKGVVATHGQLMASMRSLLSLVVHEMSRLREHVYVAYLPLGHMFEFCAELFFYGIAVRLGYASALTLIDGAPGLREHDIPDMRLLRPTIFLTVPLVLDRIRRAIFEQLDAKPRVVRLLFDHLLQYKHEWRARGYRTRICNYFLCRKARLQFGGRLEHLLVGGAPMSPETQRILSLVFDVCLEQGYGGTEVCGASHATDLHELRWGHVGAPIHGCLVKLVDWPDGGYFARDKPNPRGEIVVSGDLVTSGYYDLPKETADAYRVENGRKWYYSGDIGEVMADGCFKIIDRRKDLVKLQNGEYFSLGKIEAALKSCACVDNVCVYGTATNDFLVAVVVPNPKAVEQMARELALESLSFEQLCGSTSVRDAVGDAVRAFGKRNGLSARETPRRVTLCAEQWTPDNGMLTAALKLRRVVILNNFKTQIADMFAAVDANNN